MNICEADQFNTSTGTKNKQVILTSTGDWSTFKKRRIERLIFHELWRSAYLKQVLRICLRTLYNNHETAKELTSEDTSVQGLDKDPASS